MRKGMNSAEELQCWRNWQEQCALGKLPDAERELLALRIGERFRTRLNQLNAHGVLAARVKEMPGDAECAHQFETHCALHTRRDGKAYKHWLLSRGRRDLDTVQSGVMLLIRNVVKNWIRDRCPHTAPVSLHDLKGHERSLNQCLPVSAEPDGELARWVKRHVEAWIAEMRAEEAAGLRIRARGWALSDARAVAESGFSKSTIHKYHRALMIRWAEELRNAFPDADPESAAGVILDAMDRAGEILLKKSAEMGGSRAFGKVEAHEDER